MARLIMFQGLPGSGKTTEALRQMAMDPTGTLRVNKDEIRADLTAAGWIWSHEREADVVQRHDRHIREAFAAGFTTVISDNTNFGTHEDRLRRMAAELGATFEVRRFDLPVEECIRRDAQRTKPVGPEVIRRMAERYPEAVIPAMMRYVPDERLMPAIICDLDGTLSLFKEKGHRGPYDASRCDEDDVNLVVLDLIRTYHLRFQHILYVSGGSSSTGRKPSGSLNGTAAPPARCTCGPTRIAGRTGS